MKGGNKMNSVIVFKSGIAPETPKSPLGLERWFWTRGSNSRLHFTIVLVYHLLSPEKIRNFTACEVEAIKTTSLPKC